MVFGNDENFRFPSCSVLGIGFCESRIFERVVEFLAAVLVLKRAD